MRFPLHTITEKELSTVLQTLKVLIINTERNNSLQEALQNLYAHRNLKVGYINCSKKSLGAIIELCVEAKVVSIVAGTAYCFSPNEPFSASLIGNTVNMEKDNMCQQLLKNPQLDLFSIIGLQLYLSSPEALKELHQCYFETLRLGALRDDIAKAEPLLRESHQCYFDMNVVRYSDAPECTQHTPNGMYAEEICQLARYAGNDNLYYANISGYCGNLPPTSQTLQIVAQVIWHLVEGISSRRKEDLRNYEQNADLEKIIVNMDDKQNLLFLRSQISTRWWMKIPLNNGLYRWISCLYDDYQCACRHEVPGRWLWFYQKFSKN